MGSLPNLNELEREKLERRGFERERELARELARERVFAREKDPFREKERLPVFIHQGQIPRHNQHHRHSLTSRKVLRTRSSGTTQHVWDDPMIEHMSGYSPISSRSHRTGLAPIPPFTAQYQHQQLFISLSNTRRRESINSSIGATSVRRLLTINRGCRHKIPINIRNKILRNFILLVIAHGASCAVLIPMMGLQGSNSTWFHQEHFLHFGPDIGSVLFGMSLLISSLMCLLTTRIIQKLGFIILFIIYYSGFCLFLSAHLYPSIYTLMPAYIIFGVILGPAWIGKLTIIVSFACKLSCHQHDYNSGAPGVENSDDHKLVCNRDESVRRLSRWYHAAQDFGLIFGAVLSTIILSYVHPTTVVSMSSSFAPSEQTSITPTTTTTTMATTTMTTTVSSYPGVVSSANTLFPNQPYNTNLNQTTLENFIKNFNLKMANQKENGSIMSDQQQTPKSLKNHFQTELNYFLYQDTIDHLNYQSERHIDEMFDTNDHGERICGVHSCPVWNYLPSTAYPTTDYNGTQREFETNKVISHFNAAQLMGIFLLFGILSLVVTCLLTSVDNNLRFDSLKGISDTLIFAGPMAYFIGTEQGYMLADFSKAYVACSLGPQLVAGALVGMGIMQLIVGCTVSMLLRHTKRIVVIAAGFFFHACLLLVLSRWKPSQDDSALFYVIAAAWGVCNAVWETLIFALITLTHTNHVADVLSPLQSLRFLGLGVTFAAHGLLCEGPKILFLTILLFIAVPPYALLEIRLETQRKNQMANL